jgi:hypothetical protein
VKDNVISVDFKSKRYAKGYKINFFTKTFNMFKSMFHTTKKYNKPKVVNYDHKHIL